MRYFRTTLSIVLGIAVLIMFLTHDAVMAKEKILVWAIPNSVKHLDPQQRGTFRTVVANMYEGLTKQKPGNYDIEPALAEKWDISSDGMIYTFYLRKGVKFHDGSTFNANAVQVTYDRQMNKDSKYNKMGTFPFGGGRWGKVERLEIVDDYTIKMHMKTPFGPWLHYLSQYPCYIVSPAALDKHGKDFPYNPSGTGPFYAAKEGWKPGEKVVFRKFNDYWGKKPGFDQLIFVYMPDPQARMAALQAGQIDIMLNIHPDNILVLEKDPNVKLVKMEPSPRIWYVAMNNRRKPFTDKRVRQAMNYAIDKKAIVQQLLQGTGVEAKSVVAPAFDIYNPELPGYPYNPEKAKALLKEAGYENGFSVTLKVPEAGRGLQLPVDMCVVIQSQLKKIGVEVKIETFDWSDYRNSVLKSGNNDMCVRFWSSSIGDPDNLFYWQFHSSRATPKRYNYSNYVNPIVDRLIDQGRETTDENKRKELYKLVDWMIMSDAPLIFVDHEIVFGAVSKKVEGFMIHPSADYRSDTVYVK